MFASLLQLAGFGLFIAAAYLLGGLPAALIVGGLVLLFLGLALGNSAEPEIEQRLPFSRRGPH